jgi:hypothetical protein
VESRGTTTTPRRSTRPDAHATPPPIDMSRTDLAAQFPRPQKANTRPRSRPQLPETRADHQIGDPRRLGRGRTSGNQRDQESGAVTCRAQRGAGGVAGLRRPAARGGRRKEWARRRGCGSVRWALWRCRCRDAPLGPGGVPVFGGRHTDTWGRLVRGFRTGHVGPL